MKFLLIGFFLVFSQSAHAGSWGFVGGMNGSLAQNENPAPLDGNMGVGMGFQFGTHYSHRFSSFRLRTLAQLRTLRARRKNPGFNIQVYTLQLAVPILFEQMLTDHFGYFIGPDFAFNVNSEFTLNEVDQKLSTPTLATSAMVGLTAKLTNKLFVNLYYNQGLTEVTKDVVIQTVGFQFVTYFDRQKKRY